MDRFTYIFHNLIHDGQLRFLIKFAGRVDEERLARAFRLTLDIEPVLGCRFVERPFRPYWERCSNLDSIPLCRVIQTQDHEREIFKYTVEPLEPCEGPQVQARVFRNTEDTLVVKMSHTVADGHGLVDYLTLLAKTYRNLADSPGYHPPPNWPSDRGLGQVFRRIGLWRLIRAYLNFRYSHATWGFPSTGKECVGKSFEEKWLPQEIFSRVKEYSHRNQISVGNILLTAFYRALFSTCHTPLNKPLLVYVAADMRRYLTGGINTSVCSLTGGVFPAINHKPGDTFNDTQDAVTSALKAAAANHEWLEGIAHIGFDLTLLPFFMVRRIVRSNIERDFAAGNFHPWFSIFLTTDSEYSNFGDLGVMEEHLFTPVPYPPLCVLACITTKGNLYFTTSYCDAAVSKETIQQFIDAIVSELPA